MCEGCMQPPKEPLRGTSPVKNAFWHIETKEVEIPSKDKLIARIQQFNDYLIQLHIDIGEERRIAEREEKKELDWPQEQTCLRILEDFASHFEDVLSDKVL